jgi:hypothetical protein
MRREGMGIRAVGRVEGVHQQNGPRWVALLAHHDPAWFTAVSEGSDVTIEADEFYTRLRGAGLRVKPRLDADGIGTPQPLLALCSCGIP